MYWRSLLLFQRIYAKIVRNMRELQPYERDADQAVAETLRALYGSEEPPGRRARLSGRQIDDGILRGVESDPAPDAVVEAVLETHNVLLDALGARTSRERQLVAASVLAALRVTQLTLERGALTAAEAAAASFELG